MKNAMFNNEVKVSAKAVACARAVDASVVNVSLLSSLLLLLGLNAWAFSRL